jgi:hypothetical protein
MHIDSLLGLFNGTRRELRNWVTTAPLGSLVSPSRYLRATGFFIRTGLGGHRMLLKLRNGYEVECCANEFAPFLETFVARSYDMPTMDWPAARTIVDVGANVGRATLWFADQARNARIIAVEPPPRPPDACASTSRATTLATG